MPLASRRPIRAADLFCGAGGTSTGLLEAAKDLGRDVELVAVNHWTVAIQTHTENHRWADHFCERIENIRPEDAVPSGRLDLLVASPECTHHSPARGGKPVNDQSRAGAWDVMKWLTRLRVDHVLLENVPAFESWGPTTTGPHSRPIKKYAGQHFRAFTTALKAAGYTVDKRILNAADYGDPTDRKRLFLQARLGKGAITWPDPTHAKDGLGGRQPWRTARSIIDWTLPGRVVVFADLVHNTWQRIYRGLFENIHPALWCLVFEWSRRYTQETGKVLKLPKHIRGQYEAPYQTFLVKYRGTTPTHLDSSVLNLDEAMAALAASGEHFALLEPFLMATGGPLGQMQPRDIDRPAGAVIGNSRLGTVDPFLVQYNGISDNVPARAPSLDSPTPPLTTSGGFALADPFLVPRHGENAGQVPRVHDIDAPMPTVPAIDNQPSLIEPVMFTIDRPETNRSVSRGLNDPAPTVTGNPRIALAEPFLLGQHGGGEPRAIDDQVPTVTAKGGFIRLMDPFVDRPDGPGRGNVPRSLHEALHTIVAGKGNGHLVKPFLDECYGNGGPRSIDQPVSTATTKDRFGLVQAYLLGNWRLGIRYRMLEPHELAAAQGFPAWYKFKGTRTEIIKQVGNAVPVNLARALIGHILGAAPAVQPTPPGGPPLEQEVLA